MEAQIMHNPLNYAPIKIYGVIAISGFVVLNLWIYLEGGFGWLSILIGVVLALTIFIAIPGRMDLYYRPKAAEVTDSGVLLYQRFGKKTLFIPWSNILKLNLAMIEPSRRDWNTRDCSLFVTEKKSYTLDWKIGVAIREKYKERMGHYPQNASSPEQWRT